MSIFGTAFTYKLLADLCTNVDGLIELLFLGHLYLTGAWLQEQIPKDICLQEIGLCAHIMVTILGSIVNII